MLYNILHNVSQDDILLTNQSDFLGTCLFWGTFSRWIRFTFASNPPASSPSHRDVRTPSGFTSGGFGEIERRVCWSFHEVPFQDSTSCMDMSPQKTESAGSRLSNVLCDHREQRFLVSYWRLHRSFHQLGLRVTEADNALEPANPTTPSNAIAFSEKGTFWLLVKPALRAYFPERIQERSTSHHSIMGL